MCRAPTRFVRKRARRSPRVDLGAVAACEKQRGRSCPVVDAQAKCAIGASGCSALTDAPPLVGARAFYTSDYLAHRRPTWAASVRMVSVRTLTPECGK